MKNAPPQQQQPQLPPPPDATPPICGPTLTGWDPITRLPHEPLAAYATFRRWERDCKGEPLDVAASDLGIDAAIITDLATRFYWRERAIAIRSGAALELTPRPWAIEARILAPLPEDAAEFVRRREWAASAELIAAAVDGIRDWRSSEKPPTIADLVKLLDSATRLARLAAGMAQEGPAIATALENTLISDLSDALSKAYPPAAQPESEVPHD